jgi:hypothetical protein
MKVLICGGRNYQYGKKEFEYLDGFNELHTIELIIQGGALGGDDLGKAFAMNRGIPCAEFKANWQWHGKAAGPIRNASMLKYGQPDAIIAFPGGRGTQNMVSLGEKEGVKIFQYVDKPANKD